MKQPLYQASHDGPFTPMFVGLPIHLVVGGLTLEVLRHDITKPAKTLIKEVNEGGFQEILNSLTGTIYGSGNVELSNTRAYIELEGEEQVSIPHGKFERLGIEERQANPIAQWKFSFDYTLMPQHLPIG